MSSILDFGMKSCDCHILSLHCVNIV